MEMNSTTPILYEKKITVAVIDSGLSSLQVNTKIKFSCSLLGDDSIEDGHGHGTGLVGMLSEFCGNRIEFIIIKVLDDNCRGSSKTLIKAMDIAIDLQPDIINLSLGTEDMSLRSEFVTKCKLAITKDILLITTTNENERSLPFILDETIRIKSSKQIVDTEQLYIDQYSTFYTLGIPHIVPWKNGKYVFINRNSFAPPYFIRKFLDYKLRNSLNNYSTVTEIKKNCSNIAELKTKELKFEIPSDFDFYRSLLEITQRYIPQFEEQKITFAQGLKMNDCIDILVDTEKKFGIKIPFTYFNINDFTYISNLSNKINKVLYFHLS
ncbi:S8 family serine peptidase [Paenibacillus sp. JZ16]|uniref:S8 family serine peptidase n=1 Tax=Paenibacillus sp. JZ16 TaxID=1906272 RepID=UPI00188CD828|nr:S8 family serine peptidase [Paenibacillus sp. JZ16]